MIPPASIPATPGDYSALADYHNQCRQEPGIVAIDAEYSYDQQFKPIYTLTPVTQDQPAQGDDSTRIPVQLHNIDGPEMDRLMKRYWKLWALAQAIHGQCKILKRKPGVQWLLFGGIHFLGWLNEEPVVGNTGAAAIPVSRAGNVNSILAIVDASQGGGALIRSNDRYNIVHSAAGKEVPHG